MAMTPDDHSAVVARAAGRPVGPFMVASVLGRAGTLPAPTRPPASPAEWRTRMAAALDATDLVVASGGKLPLALGPVRAALVALRGAVRGS